MYWVTYKVSRIDGTGGNSWHSSDCPNALFRSLVDDLKHSGYDYVAKRMPQEVNPCGYSELGSRL